MDFAPLVKGDLPSLVKSRKFALTKLRSFVVPSVCQRIESDNEQHERREQADIQYRINHGLSPGVFEVCDIDLS
jgi:hypothetical protein